MDELKRRAATAALDFVRMGMTVGLGTGSTAKHVVLALGERLKAGLAITGVPTSEETAQLARSVGIPLLAYEEEWSIDVAIDGADQVDPDLNVIKGGGGALLREKIVAAAAKRLVIVVDETKRVPFLGKTFPLPVEVMPFGWRGTADQMETLGGKAILRQRGGQTFTTESGHYILDFHVDKIQDPGALEARLNSIPGVVENGLFVGRTSVLIVGTQKGVEIQEKEPAGGFL